jgi:hypothetical protein
LGLDFGMLPGPLIGMGYVPSWVGEKSHPAFSFAIIDNHRTCGVSPSSSMLIA